MFQKKSLIASAILTGLVSGVALADEAHTTPPPAPAAEGAPAEAAPAEAAPAKGKAKGAKAAAGKAKKKGAKDGCGGKDGCGSH